MKNTLLLSVVLVFLLAACKKDDPGANNNNNNPPADPFAANEALISPNANLYFIADVEDLPGVTHINQQDTIWGVTSQWSQGHCSSGNCNYGGGVGYIYGSNNWVFKTYYNGTGETQSQLLVQNYTTFITPANEPHGIILEYIQGSKVYFSQLLNNSTISWANVTLVSRDSTGQAVTPTSTPYYIKLHFNCEMKESTTGEIIRFKNAIARVKL